MSPRAEIEARLAAFQAALRDAGIDAAVVVQPVDLYYLAGTTQNAHLVVPATHEPILLVRKTLERARAESPLERIEQLRSLRDLPGALDAAGVESGRLGLELDVLPAARYLDYARRLPGYELTDCAGTAPAPACREERLGAGEDPRGGRDAFGGGRLPGARSSARG